MSKRTRAIISALFLSLAGSVSLAQRGGGDWTTSGFDAQRSSWVRGDPKISLKSVAKPGFELVWKSNLNEKGQRMVGHLTPPVLLDFYIGYRGFRTLAFIGSSSNKVTAVDTDLARVEWTKTFDGSGPAAGASADCPGGMTSGVARPTSVGYPPMGGGRGAGRGTPAKSGVGEPHEGAVTLKQAPARPPVFPPKPAATTTTGNRRVSIPPNPFAPRAQYVYAISSDGKFHSMYVSNGEEPKPSIPFLPPNAHAQGLIVVDGIAYVSTTNGCGGVDNGVWSLNLASQKVSQWKGGAEGVEGSAGPSVGPDGTVYVTSGKELVALEEGTLKPKGSYKIDAEFTSSPVVFDFKGKDLIAAAASDGKLHLIDAASIGTALATTPAFSNGRFATGALTTWQDQAGVRWVLAPSGGNEAGSAGLAGNGEVKNGAVVAWKVVEQNGAPAWQAGWASRDLVSPLPPIIVNGVVFAVSTGSPKARAVLYALDSLSGKELWSSGNTITTFVRKGGLAAGGSRVYVATQDGTQYAFGFPIEH